MGNCVLSGEMEVVGVLAAAPAVAVVLDIGGREKRDMEFMR
jgi:hypothetical protein